VEQLVSTRHPENQNEWHPVAARQREHRANDMQLRVADAITRFAGDMRFVYLHVVGFAVWMLLVEANPWPTLTLVVSLEAIFLATFVMIGQNRSAKFQLDKANHDFIEQEAELKTNTAYTLEIHAMTKEIHALTKEVRDGGNARAV
jgi:uncharacterized membrane protein